MMELLWVICILIFKTITTKKVKFWQPQWLVKPTLKLLLFVSCPVVLFKIQTAPLISRCTGSDGSLAEYSEQGQKIATHSLKGISLSSRVVMATLDETHIAIYGADVSEEGALLYLFDLKFGMTVATRRLKVFCDPPHLYCHPANSVLLLCVIQNLVVVPYILKPSLLWNLVSGEQQLSGTTF